MLLKRKTPKSDTHLRKTTTRFRMVMSQKLKKILGSEETTCKLSIAIVGFNAVKATFFKRELESFGVVDVFVFEKGNQVVDHLNLGFFQHIFVVERPRDMDLFTLLKLVRSAKQNIKITSITPLNKRTPSQEKVVLRRFAVEELAIDFDAIGINYVKKLDDFDNVIAETTFTARFANSKVLIRQKLINSARKVYLNILNNSGSYFERKADSTRRRSLALAWDILYGHLLKDPSYFNFKIDMIEKLRNSGNFDEAEEALDKYINYLHSQDETYWINEVGIIAATRKLFDFSKRIAIILQTMLKPKQLWKADLLLSRSYYLSGDLKKSILYLKQAIATSSGIHPEIENLKAVIAMRKGKQEAALRYYKRALNRSPEDYRLAYNIGLCLESLGKSYEAASYYKIALSKLPDYQKARLRLEKLQIAVA